MSIKKYAKVGAGGVLGALVMFALMMPAIHYLQIAPFNIPPSAAFLAKLGLPVQPLALFVHFGYGGFCAVVFLYLFETKVNIARAVGFSVALWLVMMVVYSPIIGWGFFGLNPDPNLPSKLQLGSSMKYIVATFALHFVYGLTMGGVSQLTITE